MKIGKSFKIDLCAVLCQQKVFALLCISIIGINLFVTGCKKDGPQIVKPVAELGETDPAFSPYGKFIAYADSNGISILELATGISTHLTDGGWDPDWSPDGKWIVYVRASNIFKINVETKEIKQLTTLGNCYFPDWSPNGNRIAFDISGGESAGIWFMDTNGTNFKLIKRYAREPDWSPSGDRLVYMNEAVGAMTPPEIFVMDSTGCNSIRLTNNQVWDDSPAWSPDGSKIAYVSNNKRNYWNIFLINTDGTNKVQLTFEPESENGYMSCEPAWSPDGEEIVYVRVEWVEDEQKIDRISHLWIMDADGKNKRQLTGK